MASIQKKSNPRRTTASNSVSLLHKPQGSAQQRLRNSDSSGSDDNPQSAGSKHVSSSNSPSSLNPLAGKHSSGESSNAEKWFEKSNNIVEDKSEAYSNNDPPYFLRNPSSSEEQQDGQGAPQNYLSPNDIANSLQMRTGLMQLGTDASSTEDFRSVIDDLTIENKKLKRRLKKYEKLHDSHLKDEKLFEVRVHGLPPDKKRELEETLRQFATQLSNRGGNEISPNVYLSMQPTLATHRTSSSSASAPNTDSAYASLSASGRESSSGGSKKGRFAQSALSRHQNIHTYLHHIPEGLLPSQNPQTMTERAKKKLVVRRLEQIFAGKGAATGGHQQALQQQDVSNSAAHADRIELEAQGQRSGKEGIREASILQGSANKGTVVRSSDAHIATADHVSASEQSEVQRPIDGASQQIVNPTQSPDRRGLEQRPTRPLDLDPHRAQVPAENMRYMRHLGFVMRDPGAGTPEDDEGWIYLNLLISMAQLHTVSVSNEFVRKAIHEFSTKLEMSEDGRKVRWKGGTSLTRTSSTGGESILERTDPDSNQSPRKRVKLNSEAPVRPSRSRRVPGNRTQPSESGRFAYTPMFFHKDSTSDEESGSEIEDEDDNGSSQFPQQIGGDSSGMTSSGIRTTVTKSKKKHDDGPIIFYNNARFCTDLSGDTRSAIGPGVPIYKAASVAPVGAPRQATSTNTFFEKRGPLVDAAVASESKNVSSDSSSESMKLDFPSTSSASTSSQASQSPLNLEVTGIGGVYPADNFAISVESRRAIVPEQAHGAVSQSMHSKVVPPRLAQLLTKGERANSSQPAKITARRKDLEPSALPPALNYMDNDSDSMSDDGSDSGDHVSIPPESLGALPSMAAPQQMDIMYDYSDDSDANMEEAYDGGEDADADDDAESDGSLDLLAAARELDPEAVRAREREYDANMAERLAEEIPAGSSAATAGGGSGFASPASHLSKAAYQRAKQELRANRPPAMHKRRTTDSIAVNTQDSSNASERGSEDDDDDEDDDGRS